MPYDDLGRLSIGAAGLRRRVADIPEFHLVIKNHSYQPAEITVPAHTKFKLIVKNEDATPDRLMILKFVPALLLAAVLPARADDFVVYSPYVIATQSELELCGYAYSDARSGDSGNASELSIAHAGTDWWKPEVYVAKYQKAADAHGGLQGYELRIPSS